MAFDYRVGDVVRVIDALESTLIPGALMLVNRVTITDLADLYEVPIVEATVIDERGFEWALLYQSDLAVDKNCMPGVPKFKPGDRCYLKRCDRYTMLQYGHGLTILTAPNWSMSIYEVAADGNSQSFWLDEEEMYAIKRSRRRRIITRRSKRWTGLTTRSARGSA